MSLAQNTAFEQHLFLVLYNIDFQKSTQKNGNNNLLIRSIEVFLTPLALYN
jgi:hypothetical protein